MLRSRAEEKGLANLWGKFKITKCARVARGREIKWKIPFKHSIFDLVEMPLPSFISQFLSPGIRVALRRVREEYHISRYHRQGMREIKRRSLARPARLNLGCGPYPKEGYLNVDIFPGGDLTLDLRRPLPFESECCQFIFSEHCFEHIDYPDVVSDLLQESLRILTPGGVLRFSVPDTEWPLLDYAKGPEAEYFRNCKKENFWYHPKYCSTPLEHINYHFRQNGEHLFAYDENTATKLLERVGFQDVRREKFDPAMDSPHRELGSLFMSGRKPAKNTP